MKHPDYPAIDFKPAIARYDWDQTYDVLEFVLLPQGFDELMAMVGIPCYELMAVDRFTPYHYLWAEQYSDYVYNFLHSFNYSPHNAVNYRTARDMNGDYILDYTRHPLWQGIIDYDSPYTIGAVGYDIYDGNYKIYTTEGWRAGVKKGVYSDSTLKALDRVEWSYNGLDRMFIALVDNAWLSPPVTMNGEVEVLNPNWLDITIVLPPFTHSNHYDTTAQYPITLGEGDYCLTFLVEQGQQEGLIGSITTINQVARYFSVPDTTTFDLNNIINGVCQDDYPLYAYHEQTGQEVHYTHPRAVVTLNEASRFCANSLVLSKKVAGTWQLQTVVTPNNFLFYADIADYFAEVSDALMQYFTTTPTYVLGMPMLLPPQSFPNNFVPQFNIVEDVGTARGTRPTFLTSHDFQEFTWDVEGFPAYFRDFCYLQRANNNKWGGTLYPDFGYTPLPSWYPLNTNFRGLYILYHDLGTLYKNTTASDREGGHAPSGVYGYNEVFGEYAMDWHSYYPITLTLNELWDTYNVLDGESFNGIVDSYITRQYIKTIQSYDFSIANDILSPPEAYPLLSELTEVTVGDFIGYPPIDNKIQYDNNIIWNRQQRIFYPRLYALKYRRSDIVFDVRLSFAMLNSAVASVNQNNVRTHYIGGGHFKSTLTGFWLDANYTSWQPHPNYLDRAKPLHDYGEGMEFLIKTSDQFTFTDGRHGDDFFEVQMITHTAYKQDATYNTYVAPPTVYIEVDESYPYTVEPEDVMLSYTLFTEQEFNEAMLANEVPEQDYLNYLLTIKAQQEAQ